MVFTRILKFTHPHPVLAAPRHFIPEQRVVGVGAVEAGAALIRELGAGRVHNSFPIAHPMMPHDRAVSQ